jgi:transcriptional regulator with XRE-family HTH domain
MTTEMDDHLGKRIRQRRRSLGLTQQQVGEVIGVRFQQIHKYECGMNRISAARLWTLARALEAPVDFFFEGLASVHKPSAHESAHTR